MTDSAADVVVIGGGIAGASVAARLAGERRVILVERESQCGYHTTGRSAAIYVPNWGLPTLKALVRASRGFLEAPPEGFADGPILSPRGILMIARGDQMEDLAALEAEHEGGARPARLSAEEVRAAMPLLREGYAAAGILDAGGFDIDVDRLHQGFLRRLRAQGGEVRTGAEVLELERDGGGWRVETARGAVRGEVVVNAGGAWAGALGRMAGAEALEIEPRRRTAMLVPGPAGMDLGHCPMTIDAGEEFYLKPQAGRLFLSPSDQTPSAPCDARPEEIDVAICADRIMQAFDLEIRRIETSWAGLRSFAPDGVPVVGFSQTAPGFFWLVGQGGDGIQTSPALSAFAAAAILGREVPEDLLEAGLDPAALAPGRFG